MKTIFVVFTSVPVTSEEIRLMKKYCFNTEDHLSVGDMIKSSSYSGPFQVVRVLDKSYKYFNSSTGDLSNDITSTHQSEIKQVVIREDDNNVVYGKIIN